MASIEVTMLQIWAACLILGLAASVHAQQADTGSVFNATRVFNLNGTVYSRAGILGPVSHYTVEGWSHSIPSWA